MPDIFVNFRTGDETFAAVLIDQTMAGWFGSAAVFRDSRSIPLGEEFTKLLWSSLAESKILLAVIGKRWLTLTSNGVRRLDMPGDYVREEISFALRHGIRVVPVLIEDTPMPRVDELPPEIAGLATHQYLRLYPRDAHRDLPMLANELSALLAGESPAERPLTVDIPAGADAAYTVIATKIEGFDLFDHGAQIASRQAMYQAMAVAAGAAGLSWQELGRADRVHGVYLLVPQHVPAAKVTERLVVGLTAGLTGRLRLRVAFHAGRAGRDAEGWAGSVLVLAGKLADAPALAPVFARSDAGLVIIVSDAFYQGVVRFGDHGLEPAAFAAVTSNGQQAWVWAPGYAYPPGLPTPASPPAAQTAAARPTPAARNVFMAPVTGPVHTGDGPQYNQAGPAAL